MKFLGGLAAIVFLCQTAYASKTPEKFKNALCSEQHFSIAELQARQEKSKFTEGNYTQWFLAENPKGVVLMIHGVGMQAKGMNPLMQPLVDSGFDVLRVTLYSHGGSTIQKNASRTEWLNEFFEAYCLARAHAQEKNLPFYFAGYSLGALVNLDLMNSGYRENIIYDKMAMLAPAITLHKKVESLHQIWWFGFVVMPKARVRAFHSLLDTYRHLQKQKWEQNIPSIIFLDKKDELVSQKKLQNKLEEFKLTNWREIEISNENYEEKKEHHYIIYPPALGKVQWKAMVDQIINFFD
jgi:alpha-beta hydrolase superfamily lysophospholipase